MPELTEFRVKIDEIDTHILDLLEQRFEIIQQIGEYKKANQLKTLDPQRWQKVLEKLESQTLQKKNLQPKMVLEIWEVIHKYSLQKQTEK